MHGIDPSPVDREHAPVVAEHASFVAHKAKLGQVDLLEPNPNPPSDPSPNPNSNPNPNPGRTVNFKNTIVILTSNTGAAAVIEAEGDPNKEDEVRLKGRG